MAPFEPSDFTEKLIQRTESARRTLRETSSDELRALVRELFPDGTHPWAAEFSKFIEEHSAEPVVRGEAGEGISFVYYPRSSPHPIGNQSICLWKANGRLCEGRHAGRLGPSNLSGEQSSRRTDENRTNSNS
jgi:hypothetical protein